MATDPLAQSLRKIILTTQANKPKTPHSQVLAKATKDVTEAEAMLKTPDATLKRYVALYRIKDAASPTKGAYAERREHLITRFKALSGSEHHISTSAWSMMSYHANSKLVLNLLKHAIDEKIDYLEVVQTNAPVHVGVSKLQS